MAVTSTDAELPTPSVAAEVFGPRVDLAERYVRLLAGTGIDHGLLGPRERPRLWERHVLNCAVVAPAFDADAEVLDIGSGAGLPGIVLAIARPDLRLTLVEPLQRRSRWLGLAVQDLNLLNVQVHTGRAEALWGTVRVRHVTARAVARLATLASWSLPLLEASGSLLALKGATAESEVALEGDEVMRLGAGGVSIDTFGVGLVDPPTVVVRVEVLRQIPAPRSVGRPRHASRAAHHARRTFS